MHAKLHDFRVTLAVIRKYRTRNFLRTAKPSARSRNTKEMAFATTRTMFAAAHGMGEIAVATLTRYVTVFRF